MQEDSSQVQWRDDIMAVASQSTQLSPSVLSGLKDWLDTAPKGLNVEELCMQTWQHVTHNILQPEHDITLHQKLLTAIYKPWPRDRLGPYPVWYPSVPEVASHNITAFLQSFQGDEAFERERNQGPVSDWAQLHALSVRNQERVLSAVILREMALPLHTQPTRVLQEAARPDDCTWLPGARVNVAWCALHAGRAGPRGDALPAVLWAEEGQPDQLSYMTRVQLRALALQVAACLRTLLNPGDAVGLVLPLTALSAAVYLGCVLAGCSAVSIADSFAAHEIEARLKIAKAKAVFTQDVVVRAGKALPLLSRVAAGPGTPPIIIIPGDCPQTALTTYPWAVTTRKPQARDCDLPWSQFITQAPAAQALKAASLPASAVPACLHVACPQEATNILFSSGTTGEPKAIVWDHVSPLRCGVDGWAHQNLQPGNRVCWPTSLGWMMGPWLLYATLLNGGCVSLYNGAPTGRDFGVFVRAAGVQVLGLVPSIVRAWRHSDCMKGLNWPDLKCISSTGEASAPDDYHWLYALTRYRAPVIEYCGGTELSGAYITATTLHPACPATFTTPSLGTQLVLLLPPSQASDQMPFSPHQTGAPPATGEVALVAPALGQSQRLLNKDHHKVYYEGMPTWQPTGRPLRRHGDELCRLPGCYYTALGRVDDTMNLGGIKVASVELERAVTEGVQQVVEVAAVGAPSPGGGPEQLILFLVVRPGSGSASPGTLLASCQAAIRSQLNPLFKVERVVVMTSLPRNASNKLMRRNLRDDLLKQQQQQQVPVTRSKL